MNAAAFKRGKTIFAKTIDPPNKNTKLEPANSKISGQCPAKM